jgi:hypothetical protein
MKQGTYIRTKETLEKMSKSLKGMVAWNKGIKHSEETKKLIGLKSKGRIPTVETRAKMSLAKVNNKNRLGIKHTMEDRIKMSKNSKGKLAREKNPNWKGGITKINDLARHTFEVNLFKQACLQRDNWTCQKTGVRGGRLVVHHIKNFSQFPELRTSIENGITLSYSAHNQFHKIYGKVNNNNEQLQEFLNNK